MLHVLFKGELTPEVKQDVVLKIMESIARIAPIKSVGSCYSSLNLRLSVIFEMY